MKYPCEPLPEDWFTTSAPVCLVFDVDLACTPDQLFTIPPGISLAPGAYAVFTKDVDHDFGLGGNDKLVLRDETGTLIDRVNWSKDEAVVSYCLIPNGGDTAQVCDEQSFGGPNVGEPIEE